MSFDLFILSPTIDREIAERFNTLQRPGLPEGLRIDVEQCSDDSTFWTIHQDGEEWAELYIDRNAAHDYRHKPAEIVAGWAEIHVPSRGEPMVFHVVAALAELSRGWVFDPQGTAEEVSLDAGEEQAGNAKHGFYTPAVTRELADVLAQKYRWD